MKTEKERLETAKDFNKALCFALDYVVTNDFYSCCSVRETMLTNYECNVGFYTVTYLFTLLNEKFATKSIIKVIVDCYADGQVEAEVIEL